MAFEEAQLRDIARTLARAHRESDPELKSVYFARDPSGQEVRLVEVSGSVGSTGAALPFRFAAREDLGVPCPSVLILLSPEEFEKLGSELSLPDSWQTRREELQPVD